MQPAFSRTGPSFINFETSNLRTCFVESQTLPAQTGAVIQKIIREDFADSTIIHIAHRIPTVMDCDRVLVIDAGNFLFIGGHYGLDR
ncbi:putative ABC-type xenobiotic transporter [Helianthus anomalus]